MFLVSANDTKYLIERMPSIFVARTGKHDVYISRRSPGPGTRAKDGHIYTCIARIKAETGNFICSYEPLPNEITIPLLRQWGFVDLVENARWPEEVKTVPASKLEGLQP